MRKLLLGLGLCAVFGAGCVAGATGFAVPGAKAASGERWAYFCFDAEGSADLQVRANQAGAHGWELITSAIHPSGTSISCFKQAAR